jgi:hypothetical protein
MEINDDNIVFAISKRTLVSKQRCQASEAGVCKPRDAKNLSKLTNSSLITNLQLKEL